MTLEFIGGIFLQVRDLEQSLEWYVEKLGMRLLFTEIWEDRRAAVLAVHPTSDAHPWVNLEETGVMVPERYRVAFNLRSRHADALYKSLQEKGVVVSDLIVWTPEQGSRHVLFDVWDPDGRRINIMQWYPVHEERETQLTPPLL